MKFCEKKLESVWTFNTSIQHRTVGSSLYNTTPSSNEGEKKEGEEKGEGKNLLYQI